MYNDYNHKEVARSSRIGLRSSGGKKSGKKEKKLASENTIAHARVRSTRD